MTAYYLTTAIDYANGDPHLGHAYEKIGADAIARYRRLRGDDVHFLVGMDEHGQKVAQTAEAQGIAPQALVDALAERFRAMWQRLGVSYDQFIRTTDERHRAGVRALIERIFERNPTDFYEKAYEGWYCVGCESFKQDAEIVDGKCILHPTRTLEWVEERNWFFRLSRYAEFLRARLTERPETLQPESRRNELLALVDRGLEDVSASRSRLAWGIPFPKSLSNGEGQTTYVWFEALPNYLTATGFPDGPWSDRWPAQLHIVGKDITRFHSIIWPAMLESAGLPLPERVWGHGFVLLGGERFSKSAGVRLDLNEADAMPNGGELTITVKPETKRVPGVRLTFADTGKGIPPDDLKRIFEPFFTNGKAKGVGLGLTITHDIIERHGGQLAISSPPGSGAVVDVWLPLRGTA